MKYVAIIGSRKFSNLGLVVAVIHAMVKKHGVDAFTFVSGGAIGVDRTATDAADLMGVATETIKPEYDKYPSSVAPKMRNTTIVAKCEIVVAFWDLTSRGTMDAVFKAKDMGKQITVLDDQGNKVAESQWIDPR